MRVSYVERKEVQFDIPTSSNHMYYNEGAKSWTVTMRLSDAKKLYYGLRDALPEVGEDA